MKHFDARSRRAMGKGRKRDAVHAAADSDRQRAFNGRENGGQTRLDAPARLVGLQFRNLTPLRHQRQSDF